MSGIKKPVISPYTVLIAVLGLVTIISFGVAAKGYSDAGRFRELYDASSGRVAELSEGIESISESVASVATELDNNAVTLRATIESLKLIAAEVENMENIIDSLGIGSRNDYSDSSDEVDSGRP